MKVRVFIFVWFVAFAVGLFANNATQNLADDTVRYNGFGSWVDNWYTELSIGGNVLFSKDARLNNGINNLTPNITIAAGKWFSPYLGARIQIEGYSAAAGSSAYGSYIGDKLQNGMFGNNDPIRDFVNIRPDGSYVYPIYFMNMHADLTVSIMSLVYGGFSNKDHWDVIPAIGLGYMHVFGVKGMPNADVITTNFSVVGKYRILPEVDVNIEVKTSLMPDMYDGRLTGSVVDPLFSFTAGVTYNIGGHKFSGKDRVVPRIKYADHQRVNDKREESYVKDVPSVSVDNSELVEKLSNLEKRLDELKQENTYITVVANKAASVEELDNKVIGTVLFDINTTNPAVEINNQLINVSALLDAFPSARIQLEGYADEETGTPEYNQQLSEARTAYVQNLLTTKYNVSNDRIVAISYGSTKKAYTTSLAEQRVVVLRLVF